MPESAAERADAVKTASEAVKELSPVAQQAAMEGAFPPPDAKTTSIIWIMAIGGLILLLVIALVGLLSLLSDDNEHAEIALTAFTSLATGFLALLAPSPVKRSGGSPQ